MDARAYRNTLARIGNFFFGQRTKYKFTSTETTIKADGHIHVTKITKDGEAARIETEKMTLETDKILKSFFGRGLDKYPL